MSVKKIKYYTIRINEHATKLKNGVWYERKEGVEFKTKLELGENRYGSVAPVFKLIDFPFYTVNPMHCTVIKEETIEVNI